MRHEEVIQRHEIAGGVRPRDLRVPKPGEYIFREVVIRRIVVDQVGKGRAAVPAAVPHQCKSVPVDCNGVGGHEEETETIFVIMEDEKFRHLQEYVVCRFWKKMDAAHTVVRFVTSWATTMEDVRQLELVLENS